MFFFFFLMIRRPPRSTLDRSSAASDVYKRQRLYSLRSAHMNFIIPREYAKIGIHDCTKTGCDTANPRIYMESAPPNYHISATKVHPRKISPFFVDQCKFSLFFPKWMTEL